MLVDIVVIGSLLGATLAYAFLVYFEKIGYKIVHLITTGGILMISLFCLSYQNI